MPSLFNQVKSNQVKANQVKANRAFIAGSRLPKAGLLFLAALLAFVSSTAQSADLIAERILPLRERAALQDEILAYRLDNLVPQLCAAKVLKRGYSSPANTMKTRLLKPCFPPLG